MMLILKISSISMTKSSRAEVLKSTTEMRYQELVLQFHQSNCQNVF